MALDFTTIGMLAILAVLIFFMFRNGQKRKREAQDLQSKVAPGAEVMTNFGLFGTVLSIDEDDNKVRLETSPGQVLTVHRQTIARVIDDEPVDKTPAEVNEDTATLSSDPEFGERSLPTDAPDSTTATSESREKKNDNS